MKSFVLLLFVTLSSVVVSAEVIQLKANYLIPTTQSEDMQFNQFELKNYQVETFADGNAVMQFELPENMVGVKGQVIQMKLTGKIDEKTKVLSSSQAKAVCEGPWRNMKCSIGFLKMNINKPELQKTLKSEFTENEAQERYKLLMRFGNDPIGVATVTGN